MLEEIRTQNKGERETQVETRTEERNNTEITEAATSTPTPTIGETGEAEKLDSNQQTDGWNIVTKKNQRKSKKRKVVISPETTTQDPELPRLPLDSSFSPLLDESDVADGVFLADGDPQHTEPTSTPPSSGGVLPIPSAPPTLIPSQKAQDGQPSDGGPRHHHLFPFPLPPRQPSPHTLPHGSETTTSRMPWISHGRQRRGSFGPLRPGSWVDGKGSTG